MQRNMHAEEVLTLTLSLPWQNLVRCAEERKYFQTFDLPVLVVAGLVWMRGKLTLFECFPYVCPEPLVVK